MLFSYYLITLMSYRCMSHDAASLGSKQIHVGLSSAHPGPAATGRGCELLSVHRSTAAVASMHMHAARKEAQWRNMLLKSKRHSLRCHDFLVHGYLLRMSTNVVDFRFMRRLCRREWNWQRNWQSVNQHSWDPWQWTTWSRRVTSDFNSVLAWKRTIHPLSGGLLRKCGKWHRLLQHITSWICKIYHRQNMNRDNAISYIPSHKISQCFCLRVKVHMAIKG